MEYYLLPYQVMVINFICLSNKLHLQMFTEMKRTYPTTQQLNQLHISPHIFQLT